MRKERMFGVCALATLGAIAGLPAAAVANDKAAPAVELIPSTTALPDFIAGFRTLADGSVELTTPLMNYAEYQAGKFGSGAPARGMFEHAFDITEVDPNTDEIGCIYLPSCDPPVPCGNRYAFTASTYSQPQTVNDMTVAPGFEGSEAKKGVFLIRNHIARPLWVLITTAESFDNTCVGPPVAPMTGYDGVVVMYANLGPGFFNTPVDLSDGDLFWQMPMDGMGSYTIQYATAMPMPMVPLQFAQNVSPGLWGDKASTPWTTLPREWRDNAAPFGMFAAPAECINNTPPIACLAVGLNASMSFSGSGTNDAPIVNIISPTNGSVFPSGANILFEGMATDEDGDLSALLNWSSSINGAFGSGDSFTFNGLSDGLHTITASVSDSKGLVGMDTVMITVGAATCPVDLNGDGSVTIADFLEFLNLFAAGDPRAEFDGNPGITVGDFLAFLNAFAKGC